MLKTIYLPTIKVIRDDAKIYPITSSNYILRFDGGSRGNPGLGGCGAVIYHNHEEIWSGYMFVGDNVTNNYAEYSGLILGLKQALELNINHLLVEGDSLLVINQLTNVYKCKSKNLLELNETAKQLATEFTSISFQHILRNKNKRADQLANFAVDHQKP
jgi:ribonuclease HI